MDMVWGEGRVVLESGVPSLWRRQLYVCMGRRRVWSTCGLAMYTVSPCDQGHVYMCVYYGCGHVTTSTLYTLFKAALIAFNSKPLVCERRAACLCGYM